MSGLDIGGASFFHSAGADAPRAGEGVLAPTPTEGREGRGGTLRQHLERAAFPAVFLTLLGTPVEAEVSSADAVGEVSVPLGEEEVLDFDAVVDLAFLLGEELEYLEEGLDAATDFWQLGEQMADLAPSADGETERALLREFTALLGVHEAVVGPYARGEGELAARVVSAVEGVTAIPSVQVADTLEGWGLNPEFQSRLSRVIDRMRTEYGMDVEVFEGYRAQSRQNDLWAQGRTRPGPIVTWTRQSRHTVGAAADVLIDGDWAKGRGAILLSRVAAEEGLRTLGPRDPGHVELPGDMTQLAARAGELDLAKQLDERFRPVPTGATARRDGEGARGVARVAPVARVARPARPGGELAALPTAGVDARAAPGAATDGLDARRQAIVEQVRADALERAPDPAANTSRTAEAAAAARLDRAFRSAKDGGEANDAEAGDLRPGRSDGFGLGSSSERSLESWVRRVGSGTPGLDMIRRVEAIRNAEPRDALRRVMIALEGADAAEVGRVRLDVRGERVDALFDIDDPTLARRIERDMAALRTQLAAEGVDPGRLKVRTGGGELAPSTDVRIDATRSSSGAETSRDRGDGGAHHQGRDQRDLTERRREFPEDQGPSRDTDMEDES